MQFRQYLLADIHIPLIYKHFNRRPSAPSFGTMYLLGMYMHHLTPITVLRHPLTGLSAGGTKKRDVCMPRQHHPVYY